MKLRKRTIVHIMPVLKAHRLAYPYVSAPAYTLNIVEYAPGWTMFCYVHFVIRGFDET